VGIKSNRSTERRIGLFNLCKVNDLKKEVDELEKTIEKLINSFEQKMGISIEVISLFEETKQNKKVIITIDTTPIKEAIKNLEKEDKLCL
jgi:tetrahydromethanopterin S-methyltransferase subunit B